MLFCTKPWLGTLYELLIVSANCLNWLSFFDSYEFTSIKFDDPEYLSELLFIKVNPDLFCCGISILVTVVAVFLLLRKK